MIPVDAYVNVTEKNDILICLCIKMTVIRKQQIPENHDKYVHYLNKFAFI